MSTHLLVSHNKALTKTRVSGILHKSPQSGVLEDENATAHLASTCKGPTTYLWKTKMGQTAESGLSSGLKHGSCNSVCTLRKALRMTVQVEQAWCSFSGWKSSFTTQEFYYWHIPIFSARITHLSPTAPWKQKSLFGWTMPMINYRHFWKAGLLFAILMLLALIFKDWIMLCHCWTNWRVFKRSKHHGAALPWSLAVCAGCVGTDSKWTSSGNNSNKELGRSWTSSLGIWIAGKSQSLLLLARV